jgi:hypothetical protein
VLKELWMRHSILVRLAGVAVPLLAAMFAAQPVAAHVVHTSGSPGNYTVTDTSTNPGAQCYYPSASHSNNDLSKIKIRAPLMYAKSGTQWVGWQYSVQHGTMAGSDAAWTTYYKSPVMKDQATVNQSASFTTQTWIAGNHINRFWRIKLLMFWYTSNSKTSITGQVNWLVDWYTVTYPPTPDYSNPDHCLPGQ